LQRSPAGQRVKEVAPVEEIDRPAARWVGIGANSRCALRKTPQTYAPMRVVDVGPAGLEPTTTAVKIARLAAATRI
jgi:hypothetical protein